MTKLRNLFGNINMTWLKVIIFSVITGVYTGLINQVPFLTDTSFTDIAVSLEFWIVFAIFIIVNCKKWWDAVLKCFVFFLISQPLVYLVEVPFLGWGCIYILYILVLCYTSDYPGFIHCFLGYKKKYSQFGNTFCCNRNACISRH